MHTLRHVICLGFNLLSLALGRCTSKLTIRMRQLKT